METKTGKLVKIGSASDLDEGKGKLVRVEDKALALFRVGDEYFAISSSCIHRGGPLHEGDLEGYEVTCPWHGWKYDIRTGSFTIIPTLKLKSFKVEQKSGELFIEE